MTTEQEWATMPAGRELDALVAERVMGWKVREWWPVMDMRKDRSRPAQDWTNGTGVVLYNPPLYSTSIVGAWDVMDAMVARGLRPSLSMMDDGRWVCDGHWDDLHGDHNADTAPLAICRAALAYFTRFPGPTTSAGEGAR